MEPLLDVSDIQRILPHRYPFLLVDRVIEVEPGKRIVAIKNVTINEPFFNGHFPGNPVMPGVLIVEAMAQAGALLMLYGRQLKGDEIMLFAGIDHARFRKSVVPGDTLRLTLETTRARSRSAHLKGEATVDGKIVAEAQIFSVLGTRPAPAAAAEKWAGKEEE